ncbi:nuclease [Gracilibacillus halophilus YIM-C55.5]|uniref:Nuclease n=1 Tax=Gracilibacillus halophilus YIM-C55.5 TaxID=1308866 RepID=N4WA99_9BACI|nr:thermonuclease family protein [Gracilibacillus halophilus]ENH97228.1 nuclease [Gracilibacillus halophilus YIM-C55.5]
MNSARLFGILCLVPLLLTGCGTATEDTNQAEVSHQTQHQNHETTQKIPPSSENENVITAQVTRVVDGDTIEVNRNGNEERVRLLLVDTPETKHPDLPVQPFGPEASAFAKEILTGENVQLEFDGPKRDHYDRLLAYIWINGENFNKRLLEEGLARYAYVYDPPYTHADDMMKAQNRAKEAEKGIWSIDNYVHEEGFQQNGETDADTSEHTQASYSNCSEARKAGVTPLYEGDEGYGTHLDRDGDGVACE